jgi:hypothetical protein
MPTQNLTVRLADDLREDAEARARQEHRSLADLIRSAVKAYLADDAAGEALRHALHRAEAAEAALERARARPTPTEKWAASKAASKRAQDDLRESREDRFAAALEDATTEDPATVPHLAVLSGFSRMWCRELLLALTEAGYAEKTDRGQWIPVPGTDVRKGIRETRSIQQARPRSARTAPEVQDGSSPAPVPAVPAAQARETAEVHSAAKGNGRIAGARAKAAAAGAPLVAAKDLPRPAARPATAVFQEPGQGMIVTEPVPEVPDHAGKPRGRAGKRCEHRLPAGAWCKTCQQPK